MNSNLYYNATRVKSNINNAISQLNSFINIVNQSFTVNDSYLDKDNISSLNSKLRTSLNYLNYTILPNIRNSK